MSISDTSRRASFVALSALLVVLSNTVLAQPSVDIGGLAYIDYSYVISSFDEAEEGYNTFDYRRVYLTTDFTLSDEFSGRVRLEAQGRSTTAQGRPAPFIKDAYLTWSDAIATGHDFRLGVQPPPLFQVSERVWGYRSLDKTVMDRVKANDSRDFGITTSGQLVPGGSVGYALMFANGNGVRPEQEGESGKHLYAQVQGATGDIRVSAGTDYKFFDGEDDTRDRALRLSGFLGMVNERFHGGVEGYYVRTSFDNPETSRGPLRGAGISAFAAVNLSERTSVVARYDFVDDNAGTVGLDEHFGLAAFVFRPHTHVELMPNVVVSKFEDADAEVTGRFTVHVRF